MRQIFFPHPPLSLNRFLAALAAAIFICSLSQPTFAATGINRQINFQGKVVNSDGTNVANGNYDFEFKLYTVGSGGSPIWTETRTGGNQVTVTDGIFQVSLGSITTLPGSVDFNTDNIYLGINFSSDGEMTPRVRFTSVPQAFNAERVSGLTVTNTTGSLTIPNSKTISFADNFTTSGASALTLTTTGTTNVTLPTSGTLLTNTASVNQTVTSTQSTGTVFGITDTTALTGAIKGLVITLSGSNAQDQTGLEFNLSNATGANLNDIVGTGSSWRVSKTGALTVTSCAGCGSGSQTPWTANIDADNFSLLDLGTNITSRAGLTVASANNGAGASGGVTASSGTGTTSTGALTLNSGNASSGTAGNIVVDVGTSTSGNGSILIGTAARTQTITIGNSTGGTITVGASSGSDLALNDAQWSVTGAGAATYASVTAPTHTASAGLTLSSGGSSDITLDSASGNIVAAANDGLTYAAGTGTTNVTLTAGGSTTTGLIVVPDTTASRVVTATTGTLNNAVGVALTTTTVGNPVRVAIQGVVSVVADNTVAVGDFIGLGTTTAGRAKSLGATYPTTTNVQVLGRALTAASAGSNINLMLTGLDNNVAGGGGGGPWTDGSGVTYLTDTAEKLGIGTTTVIGSTERLLQVGSPTNRGNAAVYGEVVSQGISDITSLTGIKDIFMYDTTADTDGGRWIDWATTDKLSWYTETLDDGPGDPCNIATDDRCYTTNFPRKVILVVTTTALYIFDASTNDLWMKFSQNAAGYALGVDTNNDPSSVTALNGVIYVGTNGSAAGGLHVFDFVNDRMWNYDGTDRSAADVGITGRNGAVAYNSDNTTALDLAVTGTLADWVKINDVSVASITGSTTAIATGAATNTAPGSGQTFVGLATDAGITVINLTAQKLLQYSDATDNDYTAVHLTRRGRLYALNTTLDQLERWNDYDSHKVGQVNGAPTVFWDEAANPGLAETIPNMIAGAPDALEVIERGSLAEENSDIIYVGHSLGLTEINDHSTTTSQRATNAWVKRFDTTRQTMIMPNAVKVALPMDGASGNVIDISAVNTTDVTAKGTPTYGVSGVRGKAMSFNGTSQYLCSDADVNGACDVDTAFNMATTGWTISAWFKHSTSIAGSDVLFDKCYNTTPAKAAACVTIYMTSTGTMVGALDDDATWTAFSSYDQMATSSLTYNDNQWHQVILSRDNANDINMYIDGQPLNLNTATGSTLTVDVSQIVGIGADCSVGAACATGANFWDGQIDDFTFSQGTTTVAQVSAAQARRLYNDARPLVNRRVVTVTDATTATASTLGDSGETWIPNEFAGLIVTLTGGTGAGQSRRVVSNTATTLTVTPNFSTTPDTTTDFKVDPESLYGASNAVYAVGITAEAPLGEARQMCVGTNDGADGGGVTCYNHQAGPNLIADLFHGDSEQMDDFSIEWTGTDYDDIRSIDLSGRALVIGSEAHFYSETRDVRLGQGLDYLANQLFNVRSEIINDGISLTGSLALEVGFTGGADLAEYYQSTQALTAGEVVGVDASGPTSVRRSTQAYQTDLLGVVATQPGLTLGSQDEHSYPIALVGRVPVKVSTENGMIHKGDYLTASAVPGHAMKATTAGRVLGTALDNLDETTLTECSGNDGPPVTSQRCGEVLVFVNLTNYLGSSVTVAMADWQQRRAVTMTTNAVSQDESVATLIAAPKNDQQEVLDFLNELKTEREQLNSQHSSEVFADRISAITEMISPQLVTDVLVAKKIKATTIEGLTITGPAEFKDKTLFAKLVTFLDSVLFRGSVTFEKAPLFANDTGGFVLIHQSTDRVEVHFTTEYEMPPLIQITPLLGSPLPDESQFPEEYRYAVTDTTTKGFSVLLEEPALTDLRFTWAALAIKEPKTFESSPLPSPSPSPVMAEIPVASEVPLPTLAPSPLATPDISPVPDSI